MEEHNFIPSPESAQTPSSEFSPQPYGGSRRKKHPWILLGLFLVGMLFLAGFTSAMIAGTRVYTAAQNGKAALERAQASAVAMDFTTAQADLEEAEESFIRAQNGMKLVAWTYPLPWVGDQVEGVRVVIDAGIESIGALEEAVSIASEVVSVLQEAQAVLADAGLPAEEYTYKDLPQETKEELLRTFAQSHPQLVQMQTKLRLAERRLDRLDALAVAPQITEAVEPFRVLLPELIAGVEVLVPLSSSIVELAGVGEDRQWLILFLNNTELRPAGGFIGVYGLMTVRDGEITNMIVDDSYAIDMFVQGNPDYVVNPPPPIRTFLQQDTWYFRDSNWSPDFPTSVQDAVQLMRQEFAFGGQPVPEVHGVIGFTPTLSEDILKVTGPVTVEGVEFTHENITRTLEELVEFEFEAIGASYEERKAIVGTLTEAVMDELFALPVSRWGEVFEVFAQNFTEKQLALFSYDSKTQEVFEENGWAAHVDPEGYDDVLMVVDANLAALKTDPSIEREVSYRIVPDEEGYVATVSMTYHHVGQFDRYTTRYRTWTRVYAPLGSELISYEGSLANDKTQNPSLAPGNALTVDELGMTSFGAFTSIEPGESRTLSFTYRLPEEFKEAVERGIYQLQVYKQMGASNNPLTLDLDFGKNVRAAEPTEDAENYGDTSYFLETILDQDSVFTVEL